MGRGSYNLRLMFQRSHTATDAIGETAGIDQNSPSHRTTSDWLLFTLPSGAIVIAPSGHDKTTLCRRLNRQAIEVAPAGKPAQTSVRSRDPRIGTVTGLCRRFYAATPSGSLPGRHPYILYANAPRRRRRGFL